MFKYACLNNISDKGLEMFTPDFEKTEEISEAQGILVRSAAMHDMEFSASGDRKSRRGSQ